MRDVPPPIGPPEPEVVTRERQDGEELLFGEAAPLIAERREARQGLRKGSATSTGWTPSDASANWR